MRAFAFELCDHRIIKNLWITTNFPSQPHVYKFESFHWQSRRGGCARRLLCPALPTEIACFVGVDFVRMKFKPHTLCCCRHSASLSISNEQTKTTVSFWFTIMQNTLTDWRCCCCLVGCSCFSLLSLKTCQEKKCFSKKEKRIPVLADSQLEKDHAACHITRGWQAANIFFFTPHSVAAAACSLLTAFVLAKRSRYNYTHTHTRKIVVLTLSIARMRALGIFCARILVPYFSSSSSFPPWLSFWLR